MRALWLRWTWRDFRGRWVQILTTGLILAFGIGAFAGLGGLREWRDRSSDLSLEAGRAHDLRIDLADGSFVRTGRLRAALARVAPGVVAAAEERLVVPSQIDASRPGKPVLVPARLVGIPLRAGGQTVDQLRVKTGTMPTAGRDAQAVLDWNFANHYALPDTGRVRLAGLGTVPYSGLGVTPQYFLVVDESGISGAESGLAVVYVPLALAARAAGRPDRVNELVLRGRPGVAPAAVERAVGEALASALPGAGARITRGSDEPVTRILYRDARNDQKTYTAFAVLLLLGATLAAFNLISRAVEAQRREIGIGMALGVEPRTLAIRPLALGLQIGLLGAALGVPVGIGLSEVIKSLFRDFLPLPAYASTFPTTLYLVGSLIAVVLPVVAATLPVRRAVGVEPVEAITTGHRSARGGATGLMRRLSVPGGAVSQLPIRNLARNMRRTVMTVIGLGAVMTAVVAVLGMVDSVRDVADRQEATVLSTSRDRLEITLGGLVPASSAVVRSIAAAPGVQRTEPGLTVSASAATRRGSLGLALSFVDPGSPIWKPAATSGTISGDGIVLASKAADDLGVAVGDTVLLRHPRRTADGGVTLAGARVRVMGIHANPVRAFAYMDTDQAARLGLGGLANTVAVLPRPGTPPGTIERAFFGREGIASVRPVAADTEALRTTVDTFNSAIQIVAFITLGLALLVAFTSTSVSVDERRREYATMFAFGLPPRAGLRVAMTESLVVGLLGTAVGLGGGLLVATWIVHGLMPDTFPDISTQVALTTGSLVTTLVVGIAAVTVAPVLAFRRVRRMDISSTLRVME